MKIIAAMLALGAAALSATQDNGSPAKLAADPITIDTTSSRSVATQVAMRNVNFYVTSNAALRIRNLRGEMRTLRGGPIVFDDKNSFAIRIASAEVGLNGTDLSNLLNEVVFSYRGAPLKRLKIHTSGTQLVQTGVMHKIIDIPFEMTSDVSATPDGLIRLHPVKTRILGINGEGLMKAFGLTLQKILDLRKAKGVTVRGNDLYMDPMTLLPPPAFEGKLVGVRVDGDQLVQTFGAVNSAPNLRIPDGAAPAYMFYKGGTLRFGKLLMLDAEMQIVSLHPTGSFGFDLDRYMQQLVAGYSKTLADSGLEVFMASAETLGKSKLAKAP
ncbi:MAG: hypothetical protein ABR582_05115 [Gemmatimonadaceae bacterium]